VTTRAAGRTLQRYMESARPASSATLRSYTMSRDATGDIAGIRSPGNYLAAVKHVCIRLWPTA